MSIIFNTVDEGVKCLHLYPVKGLETDHNHHVIPYGGEMCVELKEGKTGIKARVETLRSEELKPYNSVAYFIPETVAHIFAEMALRYEKLDVHKTTLANFKTGEGTVAAVEVHTTRMIETRCGTSKRVALQPFTSYYFQIESEGVLSSIRVEEYLVAQNGEVVQKRRIALEGMDSDVAPSDVKNITTEMAACCLDVYKLKQQIAALRAQIPEGIDYFPQPPAFDDL